VLPGYHERPGRYFLPSGFIPVRITKLLINPFSIFYLLLYFKLPVLVLIWDLEQKKLESMFPQLALAGLLQTKIFSAGIILLHLLARFDAAQLSADSADCREELDWQMGVQVATQE
jgi:hypothetical protein